MHGFQHTARVKEVAFILYWAGGRNFGVAGGCKVISIGIELFGRKYQCALVLRSCGDYIYDFKMENEWAIRK